MTFATAALVVLAVFTVMMGALVTMSIRALRDD